MYAHSPFCVQLLDQFLLSPLGRLTIKSRAVVSDQYGHPHAPCSALVSDRGSALCCGLPCALPPPAVGLVGTSLALLGPCGPSPGLRLEVLEEYEGPALSRSEDTSKAAGESHSECREGEQKGCPFARL